MRQFYFFVHTLHGGILPHEMAPFTTALEIFATAPLFEAFLSILLGQGGVNIADAYFLPLWNIFRSVDKHVIPNWCPTAIGSAGMIEH